MSMRSQIYAWNGANFNPAAAATAPAFVPGQSGVQTSIFIGGFGNNITKPAETTATEFVVIEDVSCTPSLTRCKLVSLQQHPLQSVNLGSCYYNCSVRSSCLPTSSYQHN